MRTLVKARVELKIASITILILLAANLIGCNRVQNTAVPSLQSTQTNNAIDVVANLIGMPGIRPDLFEAARSPGESVAFKSMAQSTTGQIYGPTVINIQAPDALAGFTFKGFATIGDEQFALIENSKSGEGEYVTVGDVYRGVKIIGFDGASVRYTSAAGEGQLAMNTKYSLTPLAHRGSQNDASEVQSDSSGELVRLTLSPMGRISNTLITHLGWPSSGISDEQAQHLQSQVFDGKMTQDEAAQRGLNDSMRSEYLTSALIQVKLKLSEGDAVNRETGILGGNLIVTRQGVE